MHLCVTHVTQRGEHLYKLSGRYMSKDAHAELVSNMMAAAKAAGEPSYEVSYYLVLHPGQDTATPENGNRVDLIATRLSMILLSGAPFRQKMTVRTAKGCMKHEC